MTSSQPDGAELKRIDSYQYPSGHVNHLREAQQKALDEFKELSKAKKYWIPPSGSTPASHDDETLLRYLRARKFVPADAFKQFKETEDWRTENHLDKLYDTIDIDEYEQSRRLYPQWLGTRDKRGIPVYLFEVAHLDNKAIAAYQDNTNSSLKSFSSKVPVKMLRLFALYENLTRFALPLCSALPDRPHPETPVSQSSNIVDISGVSLMQFWKLKNHMQDASLLATAYYPETLDRIFLIGAPSFFPTVWGWIKRWFDPITVSKIFVLNQKETLPTLLKFMNIEKIPKKYGGKLEFKFGDLPRIEDEIQQHLKWGTVAAGGSAQTIPAGPIKWQHGADGDLEAVAVGSKAGKQRNQVVFSVKHDANLAQMSLSPGRVVTNEGAKVANHNPAVPAMSKPSSSSAPTASTGTSENESKSSPNTVINPAEAESSGINSPAGVDQPGDITGTTSMPYRDNMTEPADSTAPVRTGTSTTRYEQQRPTLADGNVQEGTPAIARDGQGEKQSIMEPSTVGQASKEHPVPDTQEQPSIVEQAQQTAQQALSSATQAGQSVLAAVGLGGKSEPEKPIDTAPKSDPEIDNMAGRNVEEFLRSKHMSDPKA